MKPRRPSSRLPLAPLLLVALVGAAPGCKTRPWDPLYADEPVDAAPHDAQVDLYRPSIDLATLPQVCRHIFVVDTDNQLAYFNTDDSKYYDIGLLNCPTTTPDATPFSMAVGRDGTAWVEYNDGELFRVNTLNADCKPTTFDGAPDMIANFGMGFASDAAGSDKETLFIAPSGELGSIDLTTLKPTLIVSGLVGSPELTGTGDGELWGFFPAGQTRVARINKATAALDSVFVLPQLNGGMPTDWAFAFFGGDFWIFLQRAGQGSTRVFRLDPRTGGVLQVVLDSQRSIIGAGVSTCAPTN